MTAELRPYIERWEQRWRLQEALRWLPRVLTVACIAAALALVVSAGLRWSGVWWLGAVTFISALLIVSIGLIWRKRRTLYHAARYFDGQWHLQERLTTALEITSGRLPDSPLNAFQLADALAIAEAVEIRKRLPLQMNWRAWLLPLIGVGVLALATVLSVTLQAQVPALDAQTALAISDASDALQVIQQTLAQDTALDAATRAALLASLAANTEALRTPGMTPDEAFALLNQAQTDLQRATQSMQSTANAQADALRQATAALGGGEQTLAERLQEQLQRPTDAGAAADAQMAQELQNASAMLMEQFPDLADALQNAAQAAQMGDPAASQALDQALQAAQDAENSQQQNESSAQSLDSAAQQTQQSAQQVADADQQAQTQQQPTDGQAQQQPSDNAQQQAAQQSAQGQPDDSQPSDSPASDSQQSGSSDSPPQSGQSGQPNQPSSSASDPSSSTTSDQAPQNAQSATGDASAQSQTSDQQSADTPSESTGGGSSTESDGVGERSFENIYAPDASVSNTPAQDAQLAADASSAPVQPADSFSDPQQSSTVPYNQVYENYAQQASRALESDAVPVGLKDVIRAYFQGIQP